MATLLMAELLHATTVLEQVKAGFKREYTNSLLERAERNTTTTGTENEQRWVDVVADPVRGNQVVFKPPRFPVLSIKEFLVSPKNRKMVLSRDRKQKRSFARDSLKRLHKVFEIAPPVTKPKIMRLLKSLDISYEAYKHRRVDIVLRKYFTNIMKTFTEKTFKRNFFNSTPPFRPSNKADIKWSARSMSGLFKASLNTEGEFVKEPTEKLRDIMKHAKGVINGAYEALDDDAEGKTTEEMFVDRVRTYNGFAEIVNNISSIPRLNASSLIFTYFHRANPRAPIGDLLNILRDNNRGCTDVEEVILKYLLDGSSHIDSDDKEDDDKIASDPLNIVTLAGWPYEQVRPALRAEFVLLKLLTWVARESGNVELSRLVQDIYTGKYLSPRRSARDPFRMDVNNVLQLFPGLMTLMFYMVNLSKDREGRTILRELNRRFKALISIGNQASKPYAIDEHKLISMLVERLTNRCIQLFKIKSVKLADIRKHCTVVFLRSGI